MVGGIKTLSGVVRTGLSGEKKRLILIRQTPTIGKMVKYTSMFSEHVHVFICFYEHEGM